MKLNRFGLFALIVVALGFATVASAISPPVVTQPIAGIVQIAVTESPGWNDDAAKGYTGRAYKLYLTNEAAAISVPAVAGITRYTYIVPVGYTMKATDSVAATAIGNDGDESAATASVPLPLGVNTPGPKPFAPGGLTAVRAP